MSGTFAVTNRSHTVTGTNTVANRQLTIGDMIVIRGQTYKVTNVSGATTIEIAQSYRGVTGTQELSSQKLWTPKSVKRTGVLTHVTALDLTDLTSTSKRYK